MWGWFREKGNEDDKKPNVASTSSISTSSTEATRELQPLLAPTITGCYYKPIYDDMADMMHCHGHRLMNFVERITKDKKPGEWLQFGSIAVGINEATNNIALKNDKFHVERKPEGKFGDFCFFEKVKKENGIYFREITTHQGCSDIVEELFSTLEKSHPQEFVYTLIVVGNTGFSL